MDLAGKYIHQICRLLLHIKIDIIRFQEDEIDYVNDLNMLAKLFSHSMKDDALKWYFTIPKRSVDSYESLVLLFIKNFKYNIKEKSLLKDLCKIKQHSN